MAINNTLQNVKRLTINKVPSEELFQQMIASGVVKNDELYLVENGSEIIYKEWTTTSQENSFIIPFTLSNEEQSSIEVFYNGLMLINGKHYTISNNTIELLSWSTNAEDSIVLCSDILCAGIEFWGNGSSFLEQIRTRVNEIVQNLENIKSNGLSSLNNLDKTNKENFNELTANSEQEINNIMVPIPSDWNNLVYNNENNQMGLRGKLIMDQSYMPINEQDLITKKYVDDNTFKIGDILTSARTNLGDDWILCNGQTVLDNKYPVLSKIFNTSKPFNWYQVFNYANYLKSSSYTKTLSIDSNNEYVLIFLKQMNGTSDFDIKAFITKDGYTFYLIPGDYNINYLNPCFYILNNYLICQQSDGGHTDLGRQINYIDLNSITDFSSIDKWNNWSELNYRPVYKGITYFNGDYYYITYSRDTDNYTTSNHFYKVNNKINGTVTEININKPILTAENYYNYNNIFSSNNILFLQLYGRTSTTIYGYKTFYSTDGINFNDINFNGYVKAIKYKFNKWYLFSGTEVYTTDNLNNAQWTVAFTVNDGSYTLTEDDNNFYFGDCYYNGLELLPITELYCVATIKNQILGKPTGTINNTTSYLSIASTDFGFSLPIIEKDKVYCYIKAK